MNCHRRAITVTIGVLCVIGGLYLLRTSMSREDSLLAGDVHALNTAGSETGSLQDATSVESDVAPVASLKNLPIYTGHEHSVSSESPEDIDAQLDDEEEAARQEYRNAKQISDPHVGAMAEFRRLSRLPADQVRTEFKKALDEGIKELVALGDEGVPLIMSEFNRQGQTFAFQHRAIGALKAIRSPAARQALLDVATGGAAAKHRSIRRRAAGAFVATLDDRSEARRLLVSDDSGVQKVGLLAIAGQALDARLVGRLDDLLDSENDFVRWSAAKVMGQDPRAGFASEKVRALVDAVAAASKSPRANERLPRSSYTRAERDHYCYIRALSAMRGALPEMQRISRTAKGVSHDVMIIARGLQGDTSARPDTLTILHSPKGGMTRVSVVKAMGRVGGKADIALLKQIAETDPLVRERYRDVGPISVENFYPVREAASRAISDIEARLQEP